MDRLCEILKLGFAAVLGMGGAECTPDAFEPCPGKCEPEHVASPDEAVQLVAPLMK